MNRVTDVWDDLSTGYKDDLVDQDDKDNWDDLVNLDDWDD